jgi:hypothetical protein
MNNEAQSKVYKTNLQYVGYSLVQRSQAQKWPRSSPACEIVNIALSNPYKTIRAQALFSSNLARIKADHFDVIHGTISKDCSNIHFIFYF